MDIVSATQGYEAWLARQVSVVQDDLKHKHDRMKHDAFSFFRATFYRWVQIWSSVCRDVAQAPVVLAVGDLHVENFGTWRDSEGRLIWGINDFDEATPLPYTHDLIRLAASANLAIQEGQLRLKPKSACDAILSGYMDGLKEGGCPFALAERHRWLRQLVTSTKRDHRGYWRKMEKLPRIRTVPTSARRALEQMLPTPGLPYSLRHRVSGLGSLGRPRVVALADWLGGKIAREAKALVPSAQVWAGDGSGSPIVLYKTILNQAVRCPDPYVRVEGKWLVRRLSPYCSRIDLTLLPKRRDESRLLHAMGWETANIHLGTNQSIKEVTRDAGRRKSGWLSRASKDMMQVVGKDWSEFRSF